MSTADISHHAAQQADASALLRCKGLDADAVVGKVRASIGLVPGDALVLCGSLAEGLGNRYSDIDLLLLTERTDIAYTSLTDVVLFVNSQIVDVHVVSVAGTKGLIARFADWAAESRPPRAAKAFAPDERKLLHRIKNGVSLYGHPEWDGLQAALDPQALSRQLIDLSSYMAATLQVDMAGFHREGDAVSLHFAGQQLLGHLMDALLAHHGMTNANPKWRARQLACLPADWEDSFYGRKTGMTAHGLYLALSEFSSDEAPQALVGRALRIATLARRVLPMLSGDLSFGSVIPAPPDNDGAGVARLAQLDLDVAVRFRNGHYELYRLNTPSSIFSLSAREYSLVCLFDGITTVGYACRYAESLWEERDGQTLVDQIIALIGYGNFEAPAYVDEAALARLFVM